MKKGESMSVMPTKELLQKIVIARKEVNNTSLEEVQCVILCQPLEEIFKDASREEIYYELLQYGLFQPHEEIDIDALEKQNTWEIVREEYERLKRQWQGPDVPIYIFPITKEQAITNKNGVAYTNAVILFVAEGLEKKELQALFAHEYNHVCRLQYLNQTMDHISLKDSLILEGLAESAVAELYGEKWLAPWLKLYSMNELLKIWRKYFLPALHVQGVQHHFPFLYGGELPKWIGYCIGYEIVRTYKKNAPKSQPYLKSADEILAGSDFPLQ